jgi:hypothetical protein
VPDDDKPKSRGWRRAQELKKAAELELEGLKTALVDCLGREATAVDVVAIEALASATVSARRQRRVAKVTERICAWWRSCCGRLV